MDSSDIQGMHTLTRPEAQDVPVADEVREGAEPQETDDSSEEHAPSPMLFGASEDATGRPAFSLRGSLGLPRWPWGKVAVLRTELEEAQAQLARLRQEIALHVDARHELNRSHAAEVAQLEIHAEARARELVEAAIHATRTEAEQVAAVVAAQHDTALAALRADLDTATAHARTLEAALPVEIEAVRREAKLTHDAEVWALTTQAATQLESAKREAATELAAQAGRLATQADTRVDMAVRAFQAEAAKSLADTVRQHEAVVSTMRAELEAVEARRARLERDLPAAVEQARQEEQAAHATQVAALEARAAAQLDATRRDVDTALAILAEELETKAATSLETALRTAREEASRAAAETAQHHATALAALKAQLDDVEARRATLARELPLQLEAARRDAAATHAQDIAALRAQATAQVEGAVREARDEAARTTADIAMRHEAALVALRAERDDAEARRVRLAQELDVEMTKRRQAGLAHAAEIELLREQASARVEAAVKEAQDEAVRLATETAERHATTVESLRADIASMEARQAKREQDIPRLVDAARREAAAAHAAEVAALRAQAAAQVEAAVRDVRDEAARTAAAVAVRHGAALAAARHEFEESEARRARLDQDLAVQVALRREAAIAHAVELDTFRADAATQLQAAVREAGEDAARAAAEMAGRHAVALGALRTELDESEARRARLEQDVASRLDTARHEADAAHAAHVEELRKQATVQVETAVREVREQATRAAEDAKAQHEVAVATVRMESRAELARAEAQVVELLARVDAPRVDGALAPRAGGVLILPAMRQKSSTRQVAAVTAALVLSGFAGSLIAWFVAVWGLLQ